jgi:serine phosphatase RsbU (regulator of sigma subunit)
MSKANEDTTLLHRSTVMDPGDRGKASRAHYLFVVEGDGKGRQIAIGATPIVIGRSAPADLILPDQRISRSHCRVCLAMGEVIVIDLESSNGTFVDGQRISGGAPFPVGSRLQVGSHVIEHEWRVKKDVEELQELDRDLEQASQYIMSLIPRPIVEGPIQSDWVLVPCARLGGDAFGYRALDARHFAIYLIDVSGHGAGAAMHAVSIINVLRQSALPGTDFRDPGQVLTALNGMFRMDTHGDMYFTVWYGVYDREERTLAYACAGHHASFLVGPTATEATALRTRNPVIGVAPNPQFKVDVVPVISGSRLYVFSDGVFEITPATGPDWDLDDFQKLVLEPPVAGVPESRRLLSTVRERAKRTNFEDDFSLMTFTLGEPRITRSPEDTWQDRQPA